MLRLIKFSFAFLLFACWTLNANGQDTLSGNLPSLKITTGLHVIKNMNVKNKFLAKIMFN